MKQPTKLLLLLTTGLVLSGCQSEEQPPEVSVQETEQSAERELQTTKDTDDLTMDELRSEGESESEEASGDESNTDEETSTHEETEGETVASDNPYDLSDEDYQLFQEIIKNNPNLNLNEEVVAYNLKNRENFTEQYMIPGVPYAEQAEVSIHQDKVFLRAEDFTPQDAVSNFETLPYGTKVLMHQSLKKQSDKHYAGQVKIQFPDGSHRIEAIRIVLDPNLYRQAPTVYQNEGGQALTQRHEEMKNIQEKVAKAENQVGIDAEKYKQELQTPPTEPVDGVGAVENLALVVGVDVADIQEYAIAQREGDYYLVQLLTTNGDTYEGMVYGPTGQVINYDTTPDGKLQFD